MCETLPGLAFLIYRAFIIIESYLPALINDYIYTMAKQRKSQKDRITTPQSFIKNPRIKYILAAFAFLLYANTFTHDYTQDDAIVIYENMYTKQGFAGIPGLLTKDTFHGFFKTEGKDKLVSGGRYRPLTPIMFAIEYQIFGRNPMMGHLINVLLFSLLVLLLFKVLTELFHQKDQQEEWKWIIAIAVALFAAHPIHTEAVANIKGRDEIMTLMGSLGALLFAIRNTKTPSLRNKIGMMLSFFLALMAKENAITFLAVIPLSLFLFKGRQLKTALSPLLGLGVATLLFIIIRISVLGMDFGGGSFELMNNPFIKIQGNQYVPFSAGEKLATILFTLGKYVALLFFPHPLTHDYYPRHIEIMTFADWRVLLSVLVYLSMIVMFFKFWKKKPLISWAIGFYLATLSIVSNIVFPIGTNMSERFVFMPSVAFSVLLAFILVKGLSKSKPSLLMGVTGLLLLGFSVKTFTRNLVWKDDFTLFTTDVKTSQRSAKVLNAAGGALSTEAGKLQDGPRKEAMLNQAIGYLNQALEVHPNYKNAALLLGNAYFYKKDYDQSIEFYNRALQLDPDFENALRNLAIAYRDGGRNAGEQEGDLNKANRYLRESYKLNPDDIETVRLLGVSSAVSGKHSEAIVYFQKVVEQFPESVSALRNLGNAYAQSGQNELAAQYLNRANAIEQKGGN